MQIRDSTIYDTHILSSFKENKQTNKNVTTCNLSFVPTNVIHLEKRWENSFVVKFFDMEGRNAKQGYIQVMVNTISLGMPHVTPLDISIFSVCTPFNFVFRAPFYFCINFERLYLVFIFSFALLLWIKIPPPVGVFNVYDWATEHNVSSKGMLVKKRE